MKQAFVVTDLGFGDAGKGTTVDWLALRGTQKTLVVRHNGGAQSAHNVISEKGVHNRFSQFGSASLDSVYNSTLLSEFFLFDPIEFYLEHDQLMRKTGTTHLRMMFIDRRAKVVTPWHRLATQIREWLRGGNRHGSTGLGIGECMRHAEQHSPVTVGMGGTRLIHQLWQVRDWFEAEYGEHFNNLPEDLRGMVTSVMRDNLITGFADVVELANRHCGIEAEEVLQKINSSDWDRVIFEGGQGVLLDEWYGFHPYTTWSTTTTENANSILAEVDWQHPVTRLGVLRGYMTRHGAGPFPTESDELTDEIPDQHNETYQWAGHVRVGYPDVTLWRYALDVCGDIDSLFITCLDRMIGRNWTVAVNYGGRQLPVPTDRYDLVEREQTSNDLFNVIPTYQDYGQINSYGEARDYARAIAERLDKPLFGVSCGPTRMDKQRL